MKPHHISLNIVHSGCKPSTFISSFTHSYLVFLPLPAHLIPATTIFLQADTQSSPLLRSTCPNHLNLPRLTTSATLFTPRRLKRVVLAFMADLSKLIPQGNPPSHASTLFVSCCKMYDDLILATCSFVCKMPRDEVIFKFKLNCYANGKIERSLQIKKWIQSD